jgi:all-trans-8'-apo-beta-carotenal 15,15'-oxygenase
MVETPGYLRETERKQRLFGGYNTPLQRPFREALLGDRKNPANTGVLVWQERVFALCEAGKPYELSSSDLRTVGEMDLGVVKGSFNPHPRPIGSRRATYSIGLRIGAKSFVDLYELPWEGTPRCFASLPVGDLPMMHDFAVTERHLVLFVPPMGLRLWPFLTGKLGLADAATWDQSRGTEIIVVSLDAPHEVQRVRTDAFYMEHTANAYEDGEGIVIEFTRYDTHQHFEALVSDIVRGATGDGAGLSLCRMRLDTKRQRAPVEPITSELGELPQVASTRLGLQHRYTYLAGQSSKSPTPGELFPAVLKVDTQTGGITRFSFGADCIASEPLFVRRKDSSIEDDGYLLVLVFDPKDGCSYEAVLDAQHLADGPVATARYGHMVTPRFHGAFVRSRG